MRLRGSAVSKLLVVALVASWVAGCASSSASSPAASLSLVGTTTGGTASSSAPAATPNPPSDPPPTTSSVAPAPTSTAAPAPTSAAAPAPTTAAGSASTLTPTTTLAIESGNNTSAADSFTGTSNGNIAAGSVSKMPLRSLLYAGSATKMYANWVPWWGTSNHINIGYSSTDTVQLHRQVTDMSSRGIDGLIVDWYSSGSLETATQGMKAEIEQHPGFEFALMPDSGAYSGVSDPTAKLIADINYAAQTYFVSPNYMRLNGKPVVFPFGLESFPIDWNRVNANVQVQPAFIFRNLVGFTSADSSGAYAWGPDQPLGYWVYFYPNALPLNMPTYGSASKGFNDSLAAWGQNRYVDQQCGQRWLATFAEASSYYSASQPLPYMQLVTWNDYEEGTAIESGIDNCVGVSAQISGTQLTWTVRGQENTIDHYSVFISQDGQNLADLLDVPAGTHALDLSRYALSPISYTVYVKAVGKASIRNQMSNAVSYLPAGEISMSLQK